MIESNVEEIIVLTFVENAGVFGLNADQIISLDELGVSGQVITAMLQHDQEVLSGQRAILPGNGPASDPLPFRVHEETGIKLQSTPATVNAPDTSKQAAMASASTAAAKVNDVTTQSSFPPEENRQERPSAAPETQKPRYPTRKPYPVRFLPSIIFVNAPESTPDAVIVAGFAAR